MVSLVSEADGLEAAGFSTVFAPDAPYISGVGGALSRIAVLGMIEPNASAAFDSLDRGTARPMCMLRNLVVARTGFRTGAVEHRSRGLPGTGRPELDPLRLSHTITS